MPNKKTTVSPSYVVRVLESQWDVRHEQSIRPFFEELRRGRQLYSKGRRDRSHTRLESDPLFDYYVFNGADNLNALLAQPFAGIGSRRKVVYIGSHGTFDAIHTLTDESITRARLRNALTGSRIHGIVFGSCLFGNRKNAEFFLESRNVDWVAGYDRTVDWLASTISDVLFLRMLMDGWFRMTAVQERAVKIQNVREAARCLYGAFPVAAELGFNVFFRAKGPGGGIRETLAPWREAAQQEPGGDGTSRRA